MFKNLVKQRFLSKFQTYKNALPISSFTNYIHNSKNNIQNADYNNNANFKTTKNFCNLNDNNQTYNAALDILSQPKLSTDRKFKISIVGCPNVGKSTLFNFLVNQNKSLIMNTAGTTRDRIKDVMKTFDFPIEIIDTAGFEFDKIDEEDMDKDMFEQTKIAIAESHLVLFVVDCRTGISLRDYELAKWFRRHVIERERVYYDLETYSKSDTKNKEIALSDFDNKLIVNRIQLVGNKCENDYNPEAENEIYNLDLGEPIYISGEHGDNTHDLFKVIIESVPEYYKEQYANIRIKRKQKYKMIRKQIKLDLKTFINENPDDKKVKEISIDDTLFEFDTVFKNPEDISDFDSDSETPAEDYLNIGLMQDKIGINTNNYFKHNTINLAVIGKPNSGKSTFINHIVSENRCLVSPEPGTTRDCVDIKLVYKNKKVRIVDTAGMTYQSRKKDHCERMAADKATNAIKEAQVVIVLIDSLIAFQKFDFDLAERVVEEGKALILVVNKWDLVTEEWKEKAARFMMKQVRIGFGIVRKIPLHFISATDGIRAFNVQDEVLSVYEKWNSRVSTNLLNLWSKKFVYTHKQPNEGLKTQRLKYINQIKARPPTFIAFVNYHNLLSVQYEKFLRNSLTNEFEMGGVPIRISFRGLKYKKLKQNVEKVIRTTMDSNKIRHMFIKRRNINYATKLKLTNKV